MKSFYLLLVTILFFSCVSKKKQARYLDYKIMNGRYAKVTDSLYADICEVSNIQYREFLYYLKQNGKDSLAQAYDFDSTRWLTAVAGGEPMVNYYHDHPSYMNYPAVNISYEAATAYCMFITEVYNKFPKRKYKSVVFRLPTKEEWELAALAGRVASYFPWGGPYLRNRDGDFLANFVNTDEGTAKDTVINGRRLILIERDWSSGSAGSYDMKGFITTPVKSYFPNRYGLYNMAGNVSEMLLKKGSTKGGNWNSTGYYMRIDAEDEFGGELDHPSPYVGFRVFAEVVEQ